jgi:hypothetical protein
MSNDAANEENKESRHTRYDECETTFVGKAHLCPANDDGYSREFNKVFKKP